MKLVSNLLQALVYHSIICLVLPFSIENPEKSTTTTTSLVQQQLGYLPSNFVSVSAWTLIDNGNDNNNDQQHPIAIKTYPLQGGSKTRQAKAEIPGAAINSPFPTLYWLSCPDISRAVADLERRGFIQEFEATIKADPALRRRLRQCHEEYAVDRWNSLSEEDRSLLCNEDDPSVSRMRNMMQHSGISGTNFTMFDIDNDNDNDNTSDDGEEEVFVAPIKCLHAHYAHYRSTTTLMEAPPTTEQSLFASNPVGEMIHEALSKEFPELQL